MNPVLAEAMQASLVARQSLEVSADELLPFAKTLLDHDNRLALVSGHEDESGLRVTYVFTGGPPNRCVELTLRVDAARPIVPSLASVSFSANRFERELHDLFGIESEGHHNLAALVSHGKWADNWYPLRRDAGVAVFDHHAQEPYSFAEVHGPGVYEIPVGPVHAGMIEPGHFRFSVVGETILTMKMRLFFVHRGIERMFVGRRPEDAIALTERISGDSAVAHTLSYCRAVEDALGIATNHEIEVLRLVLLELERLYNHVGDIGMMCNDVAFGFVQAQCSRIREQLLRINKTVTGHRLLRGGICIGGASLRALPTIPDLQAILADLASIRDIAVANATLLDRFIDTGVLSRVAGAELGVLGYVARASDIDYDARKSHDKTGLYEGLCVPVQNKGDVMARFIQRLEEFAASVALLCHYLPVIKNLSASSMMPDIATGTVSGIGISEGWRGVVIHRIELRNGLLDRVKIVDPSFLNWPALPIALNDTIVPDFPLVNKSFNQSYAGNDL